MNRIVVEPEYAQALGEATYRFAYLEWAVICIIERHRPGYSGDISRMRPQTAHGVLRDLREAIDTAQFHEAKISREELVALADRFEDLIYLRNALIHAWPFTDHSGAQRLLRQEPTVRHQPDVVWKIEAINEVNTRFDTAASATVELLHR